MNKYEIIIGLREKAVIEVIAEDRNQAEAKANKLLEAGKFKRLKEFTEEIESIEQVQE